MLIDDQAGAGFFLDLGIPIPLTTQSINSEVQGLLVWGGASSVGSWAIQIGKAIGFNVFATASPTHHEYLRGLGATEVFDYKDPDVIHKLSALAKSAQITRAFDAVGGKASADCARVVAASGSGGKVAAVSDWPEGEAKSDGVTNSRILAFNIFTEKSEVGQWLFNDWLGDALAKKTVVPSPKVEVVEGGIRSTQKVWDTLKAGVSGKKLVIKVE